MTRGRRIEGDVRVANWDFLGVEKMNATDSI